MVDFAELIKLAIGASILLLVVSLGMGTAFSDARSFFRALFKPPRRRLRGTPTGRTPVRCYGMLWDAMGTLTGSESSSTRYGQ